MTSPTVQEAGAELGRAFANFWAALARELQPAMQQAARQLDEVALALGRNLAALNRRLHPYRTAVEDYRRWDAALVFGLPPADRADGGRLLLGLDD